MMEHKKELPTDTVITTLPPRSGEKPIIRESSDSSPTESRSSGIQIADKHHLDLVKAEELEYFIDVFRNRKKGAIETFIQLVTEIVPPQNVTVHQDNIWPASQNHPLFESLIIQNRDGTLSLFIPFFDRTLELQYTQELMEEVILNHHAMLRAIVQIAHREHENERHFQIQSETFMALAHDLRNKIGGVLGNTDFLRGMERDPEKKEILDEIKMCVDGATRMLDHSVVLYADRLGGIKLKKKRTNLRDLISRATKEFHRHCRVRYLASTHVIDADPVHLERVIDNLVHNALKFTDDDDMTVEMEVFESGSSVIIEVRDHGYGLSEDPQLLFDYFKQGKARDGKGGYGIGLGYCRMICEKHGGKISAKNNDHDKGATFRIELPISSPAEA